MNLHERAVATEATLARYRDKPFAWRGATCIHLARFQARNMGHKVPAMPQIRSPRSALTALAALGHADTVGLLDSLFPRIVPAAMLIGDLAAVPGSPEQGEEAARLQAIFIADGVGNLFGWHAATNFDALRPVKDAIGDVIAAWRL